MQNEPNTGTASGEPNKQGFIGRELTDHKISKLNRECINVVTADLRANDNAHHKYKIFVNKDTDTLGVTVHEVEIQFQNGGLKDVGPNGITEQALIAIILDRYRSFNGGQFGCLENSMVITKLEEALMWSGKRAADRAQRGVEGQRIA